MSWLTYEVWIVGVLFQANLYQGASIHEYNEYIGILLASPVFYIYPRVFFMFSWDSSHYNVVYLFKLLLLDNILVQLLSLAKKGFVDIFACLYFANEKPFLLYITIGFSFNICLVFCEVVPNQFFCKLGSKCTWKSTNFYYSFYPLKRKWEPTEFGISLG